MSFGPKLELPAECSPGQEVAVILAFVPPAAEFERELTIFVEEPTGLRQLDITVKSRPQEKNSPQSTQRTQRKM